jgi:hypothetical protein
MKIFKFVLPIHVIVMVFLLQGTSVAQTFKPQLYDSTLKKSELRVGIRYTSDYYYMGRADSVAAPYLSPTLGYFHKSGFSIRSSLSYLTAQAEGRVDLITLSGGYDYYGKEIALGVSLTEYFFNNLSYAVQAEMSTYLNAYAGHDFSAFMLFADASLGFSEGTDVFLGAEINRTFYAVRNRLRITPAIYMNAGTQKYYNEYYVNRSTQTGFRNAKGRGSGGQQSSTTQQLQVATSDKFEILDYETDLQISYKVRKVQLYALATWVFAVNPAKIVTDNGTYEEELKNGFYWSSGIRLTL